MVTSLAGDASLRAGPSDKFLPWLMNDVDRLILFNVCLYFGAFWLLLEIGFFFVVYFHLLPGLQKLTKPHPFHTDTVKFMERILDSVHEIKSYSFEKYISGFFQGAKFEDVYQGNFLSFLAWAMVGKRLDDVTEKDMELILKVSEYAAQHHPAVAKVKPGFNPDVRHCAMTLEPIPIIHRPLLTYVLVNLMEIVFNTIFLKACGFQSLEIDGMTYWYKNQGLLNSSAGSSSSPSSAFPSTCSTGQEPLVFLHGISTGWMLYLQIAKALSHNRTLILVDLDAIKIKSMTFKMPTPLQFVDKFCRLLDRHHIERVSVVGHSFGSITAGWLATHCAHRVSHLTLIDPVSMLLAFPEVSYSFLYRQPRKLTEWVIYLMASRELTISHTLHRHFWWYNNNFWLEDVPAHIGVVVGLASGDEITNPQALQEYVANCQAKRAAKRGSRNADGTAVEIAPIECLLWEGYSHGQILAPTGHQAYLVATVKANEMAGTGVGAGAGGLKAKTV